LVFKRFHFAWTDIGIVAHDAIVSYSLAFMDHYVEGKPDEKGITQAMPGVALYLYFPGLEINTGTSNRK
jgi:hypothetical protein